MRQPQWADRYSRKSALQEGRLSASPDVPRSDTFAILWESLTEFEKRMSDFFQQGFADFLALEFSPHYSAQFVAATISLQVGHDLEVLTRAMGQRTIYKALDGKRVAQTLQLADLIAYYVALKPAIDAKLIPPTTVVTYFEKSVNIRVIPYAPVALIGFPFRAIATNLTQIDSETEISNLADLLAIPHEIGHYVYWHSPTSGRRSVSLLKKMFGQPQWVQNWLEEIYADMYGFVIAGKHAAWQLMRLLQSVSRAGLFYDNGEHPVPILRIHAAVTALKALNLSVTATQLEDEWRTWLSLQPHEDGFHPATSEEFITWENAMPVIAQVVDTIMTDIFADLLWKNNENQERIINTQQDVQKSFNDKFLQVVEILQASQGVEGAFKIPEYQIGEEQSSQSEMVIRAAGKTETWIDQFLELDPASNAFSSLKLPVAVWLAILEAGGWITGPQGNIIQPKIDPKSTKQ